MMLIQIMLISANPSMDQDASDNLQRLTRPTQVTIVTIEEAVDAAIKILLTHPPHLILLPLNFPGSPDLTLVQQYRAAHFNGGVIVLCPLYDLPGLEELEQSQVQGIIFTALSRAEAELFIYAVADRQPNTLQQQYAVVSAKSQLTLPARSYGLIEREVAILRLVAAELSDKEIATQLGVTAKAISKSLQTIYKKLDVKGRLGAALKATKEGIIRKSNLY